MVKQINGLFQCEECKLHYQEKNWAEKCEAWCKQHNSCNLKITKHSIEAEKAQSLQPVVFDVLDTLLDESAIYKKFYNSIMEKYSLRFTPNEFVEFLFEEHRKIIFTNPHYSFEKTVEEAYQYTVPDANKKDLELLFPLYSELQLLPGIKEMLAKTKEKYALYTLTNCSNKLTKSFQLNERSPTKFTKIFTSEDNGVYKPNPKAYQKVADFIGLPKEKIIYISGNNWDVEKAKEFGFKSIPINEFKKLIETNQTIQ